MRSVTTKVILILLLSSTAAFCQDFNIYPFSMIDYSFLGAGARARAMGGAFTGVADDASALTWNPAGLIQVDKTQASISGIYLPLQLKTKLTYPHATNASHNINSKFSDDKLKPSFASFVAPIRIKGHPFMASVTYNSVQNQINVEYNAADVTFRTEAQGQVFRGTATQESNRTVKGGLDVISLGFGTGLYGDLAFGGAVNIYTGSTESTHRADFTKVLPLSDSQLSDSILFHNASTVLDKADSKGFNFSTSLFYHKDKFRAGLMVKTPFQLITNHDLLRGDTMYARSIKVEGQGVPTAGQINPRLYRGKTKIDIPTDISLGISYQVTPNLLLAGDFEYAGYSSSKYSVRAEVDSIKLKDSRDPMDTIATFTLPWSIYYYVPYQGSSYNSAGDLSEVFSTFDLKLDNSTQLRFGGEYTLKTSVGIIPIRAGFRMSQGPYREVTNVLRDDKGQPQYVSVGADSGQFALGKKVTHTAVSFGTGIHWRQIWLDLAAEFNSEKQTESGIAFWGEFQTEKQRNGPAMTINFTGFF
ncbi:MAG: outer membrane protein transport protein [candidate division Zixibacteria bacterium]|nr:outer membrane protein transport protein [candidate division Zixibacteria bacterium]